MSHLDVPYRGVNARVEESAISINIAPRCPIIHQGSLGVISFCCQPGRLVCRAAAAMIQAQMAEAALCRAARIRAGVAAAWLPVRPGRASQKAVGNETAQQPRGARLSG